MNTSSVKEPRSRWHGPKHVFGFHYDLHATEKDAELGLRCSPKELVPMLRLTGADFVQTDCKGVYGYTSWFSKVKHASVPPLLKKDALKQWREATRELGLPLHCHYCGTWDKAAGVMHPDWCTLDSTGGPAGHAAPTGQNAGAPTGEIMCPRGPYLEELMIPQMIELIDRYQVDGFWIDADIWAVLPCYCPRCRAAFTEASGLKKPPVLETDPAWPIWWNFTKQSFQAFVTRYCDAVHAHKPGVLICSNWLQTFSDPGEPKVPTDWISGDNTSVYGLDGSRCEARFLSTRGKHWDIMLWNFYTSYQAKPESPCTPKPPQMLMQEAAVLLSFGGSVQLYEAETKLRDGRLAAWRMRRIREVGHFVKKRVALCHATETIPQVAVLHSEVHLRETANCKSLFWGPDFEPVKGAVFALLENHFGVDVLDEWALLLRLAEFPAVFVPERHALSEEMVTALKGYVRSGGHLILTGAKTFERFGSEFLGVTPGRIEEGATYFVPAEDGAMALFSKTWRLMKATTARALGRLGRTALTDAELLEHPAATLNRVGRGTVAYIPADVCRDFEHNRYPLIRAFIGDVTRKTVGPLPISVRAPLCVDVAFRRKGAQTIIHLVNRSSGIPNQPNNGAIDEIPSVGPIVIKIKTPKRPASVKAAWEGSQPAWSHRGNALTITLPSLHIHEAIVIR